MKVLENAGLNNLLVSFLNKNLTSYVLVLGENGNILDASTSSFEKILAKDHSQIKPSFFRNIFHELYHAEIEQILNDFRDKKQSEYVKEKLICYCLDGDVFPVEVRMQSVESETSFYTLAILRDLSAQTQLKTALDESEKTLRALISTAVDGIITINERGVVETMNPSASRMFGYSPDEVIGNNVSMLMPEPDKSGHDQYIQNYQQTKKPKIIGIGREVTGLRKDGTTFPFTLGVSEVRLDDRIFYTGIIHDLSIQKLNEEQLRRVAEDLRRSNRELEDFAYVSSHDLQEPLRKIQAFGDRIKSKDFENLSEQSQEYLVRMLNASSRMQRLINDLLAFSRISTKAKPFETVDLNVVLQEVVSDLEIAIEKSNATIRLDSLPTIEADPTQMRQLFQNLIANAIKFQPEGQKPVVEISSNLIQKQPHLTATPGDQYLEIRVKDNGIGFDDTYASKIFNIFQRLEGRKFEGSGIGLSVCKRIANRHGGDIRAESKMGVGSTFIINLAMKQT